MRLSRQKQFGFRVRWIDHDHGTMHVANGIQTDLGTYSYLLTPHRRSNDRRLTDRSDDQSAKLPSKTHFRCDLPLPASSTFYIPSIRASFVVVLSARTRNSVCPSTIGTKKSRRDARSMRRSKQGARASAIKLGRLIQGAFNA